MGLNSGIGDHFERNTKTMKRGAIMRNEKALLQTISDLEKEGEQLIEQLHRSHTFVSLSGWIGAFAMAFVGVGLAIMLGAGSFFVVALIGGIGSLLGHWIGQKGGEWRKAFSLSKISPALLEKREALRNAKIDLMQQIALDTTEYFEPTSPFEKAFDTEVPFDFIPRFKGETEVIYGKPSHADGIRKLQQLEANLKEKRREKIKLKVLRLSDIDLIQGEAFRELIAATLRIFNPETLILKNSYLRDEEIKHLKDILLEDTERFSRLKELDLRKNYLTAKSLQTIEAIANSFDLKILDLSHNPFSPSRAMLIRVEAHNRVITTTIQESVPRSVQIEWKKSNRFYFLKEINGCSQFTQAWADNFHDTFQRITLEIDPQSDLQSDRTFTRQFDRTKIQNETFIFENNTQIQKQKGSRQHKKSA